MATSTTWRTSTLQAPAWMSSLTKCHGHNLKKLRWSSRHPNRPLYLRKVICQPDDITRRIGYTFHTWSQSEHLRGSTIYALQPALVLAQQFSIHATASNNVSNTLLRNIQRSCNIQFAACTEAAAPIYFVLGFAMRIKATALLERNKSPRGGHPRYKNARTMDEVFEPKAAVAGYIPWYVEYIPIVAGWWAFRTVFETAHMSDGNTRVILMITPSPRKYRLSTWVKPSWYSLVH